jgi:hypothetical protein
LFFSIGQGGASMVPGQIGSTPHSKSNFRFHITKSLQQKTTISFIEKKEP